MQPEAVDVDPAATSIPNDETANKNGGDTSAPTDVADLKAESNAATAIGAENGDAVKTDDVVESKPSNGEKHERKYNNDRGDHRGGKGRDYERKPYKNNNKFDPATMPVSSDASKIRAQVGYDSHHVLLCYF